MGRDFVNRGSDSPELEKRREEETSSLCAAWNCCGEIALCDSLEHWLNAASPCSRLSDANRVAMFRNMVFTGSISKD